MFVTWKLRASPRRLTRYGGAPAISSPLRRIEPLRWTKPAADQIEQRRLAGAVRADDGEALASTDVERDAADDRRRAEALLDAAQLQRGSAESRSRPSMRPYSQLAPPGGQRPACGQFVAGARPGGGHPAPRRAKCREAGGEHQRRRRSTAMAWRHRAAIPGDASAFPAPAASIRESSSRSAARRRRPSPAPARARSHTPPRRDPKRARCGRWRRCITMRPARPGRREQDDRHEEEAEIQEPRAGVAAQARSAAT